MKQRRSCTIIQDKSGFTIIELLVATSVFSVILLVVTTGIMSFTKSYYKGITETDTQNVARNIMNGIAQAIQFSSAESGFVPLGAPGGSDTGAFCINNTRYSYVVGKELTDTTPVPAGQTAHVLVMDSAPNCSTSTPGLNVTGALAMAGKQELVSPSMRLAKLTVGLQSAAGASPKAYAVAVRVVYGDDDLLCSPGVPGSCASSATMSASNLARSDIQCKSTAGSQFCSVSDLSTVVEKRL
jgi:prepilin-type N-terminal cleavage/methylation domain-containing protein